MTASVRHLLDSFSALPEAEKHELASEILRWSARAEHAPLADDELVRAADVVFLALDEQEEACRPESSG